MNYKFLLSCVLLFGVTESFCSEKSPIFPEEGNGVSRDATMSVNPEGNFIRLAEEPLTSEQIAAMKPYGVSFLHHIFEWLEDDHSKKEVMADLKFSILVTYHSHLPFLYSSELAERFKFSDTELSVVHDSGDALVSLTLGFLSTPSLDLSNIKSLLQTAIEAANSGENLRRLASTYLVLCNTNKAW